MQNKMQYYSHQSHAIRLSGKVSLIHPKCNSFNETETKFAFKYFPYILFQLSYRYPLFVHCDETLNSLCHCEKLY